MAQPHAIAPLAAETLDHIARHGIGASRPAYARRTTQPPPTSTTRATLAFIARSGGKERTNTARHTATTITTLNFIAAQGKKKRPRRASYARTQPVAVLDVARMVHLSAADMRRRRCYDPHSRVAEYRRIVRAAAARYVCPTEAKSGTYTRMLILDDETAASESVVVYGVACPCDADVVEDFREHSTVTTAEVTAMYNRQLFPSVARPGSSLPVHVDHNIKGDVIGEWVDTAQSPNGTLWAALRLSPAVSSYAREQIKGITDRTLSRSGLSVSYSTKYLRQVEHVLPLEISVVGHGGEGMGPGARAIEVQPASSAGTDGQISNRLHQMAAAIGV